MLGSQIQTSPRGGGASEGERKEWQETEVAACKRGGGGGAVGQDKVNGLHGRARE